MQHHGPSPPLPPSNASLPRPHFQVAAGQSKLSPVSIMVLHLYTLETNIYKDCNRAMRLNDTKVIFQWRVFIYHLTTALNCLPTQGATVFRGIQGIDISKCILQYIPGSTITWGAFSSTSVSRKV